MQLTPAQLAQYERDGFLIFPELFGPAEVAVLRQEVVARLSRLETEEVIRELTGGVKSIFRVHEDDGATRSAPFRALVRTPRVLRPVQQVLGGDAYVYHTKINAKPAIEGTIWMWHQDYNSWSRDGCPAPNMATFNVMLNDTSEFGGGLYMIPGSHKLGLQESVMDTSTGYRLWVIPKERMIEIQRNSPLPVAVTGKAGTAALFHCNILHASGHNLSAEDRWHIYVSCNSVANKPVLGPNPRPDWVVSRNWNPLPIEGDSGVTRAA